MPLVGIVMVMRRQEVPYTHRHHAIMMVTTKMELHIGEQTFHEVISMRNVI